MPLLRRPTTVSWGKKRLTGKCMSNKLIYIAIFDKSVNHCIIDCDLSYLVIPNYWSVCLMFFHYCWWSSILDGSLCCSDFSSFYRTHNAVRRPISYVEPSPQHFVVLCRKQCYVCVLPHLQFSACTVLKSSFFLLPRTCSLDVHMPCSLASSCEASAAG